MIATTPLEIGVAIILVVIAAVASWPQALRCMAGHTHGVSLTTATLAAVTQIGWAGYASLVADLPGIWASIVVGVGWLVTIASVVHHEHERRAAAAIGFAVSLGALISVVFLYAHGSEALLGGVAVVGGLLWALPQALSARQTDLDGVSLIAWALILTENFLWVGWAVHEALWLYLVSPTVQIPAAVFVVFEVVRFRRRADESALSA